MNAYFDNHSYFEYLLEHCTGPLPEDGQGRLAGARQLVFFLERLGLSKSDVTLEVGCGTGRILNFLYDRFGIEGYGVDPCKEAVEYLQQQRPQWADRINYTPDGVLNGLPNSFFDRVVFWGVFELTDQARTLVEVSRLAKPGARILLNNVRNANFLDDDVSMTAAVKAYKEKQIPIKLTEVDRIEALMAFLGLSIEERYVFKYKDDVVVDKFEADRQSSRFAEATYVLGKTNSVPLDLDIARTAY